MSNLYWLPLLMSNICYFHVTHSDNNFRYENWMEKLPAALHKVPLNFLAIPGSHDSGSYAIRVNSSISPDAHPIYQVAVKHLGRWMKFIVSKWAQTQALNISQQLKMGIRYLDLRIAPYHQDRSLFYIVHEMFSVPLDTVLQDVVQFQKDHPHEVILLDFNHFYDMEEEEHMKLMTSLNATLGEHLFPETKDGFGAPSLDELWNANKRLILFYHETNPFHFPFWSKERCPSLWPNRYDTSNMISKINESLSTLRQSSEQFSVVQGVLTPRVANIALHALQGLSYMSEPATRAFVDWLQRRNITDHNLDNVNICIVDFVERHDFIHHVVQLNYRRAH